jgi:hypothetical protein
MGVGRCAFSLSARGGSPARRPRPTAGAVERAAPIAARSCSLLNLPDPADEKAAANDASDDKTAVKVPAAADDPVPVDHDAAEDEVAVADEVAAVADTDGAHGRSTGARWRRTWPCTGGRRVPGDDRRRDAWAARGYSRGRRGRAPSHIVCTGRAK